MLLTGGSGSDELWFNDVHVLDITSWLWIQVDPKGGVVPSPRDYATINVIADVSSVPVCCDSMCACVVLVCSSVWRV